MGLLRDLKAYRELQRIPARQRQIVFYAESGQDWHHLQPLVRALTGPLQRHILYVSSDPNDPGLKFDSPRLRGICIGDGLLRIVLFHTLRADVVVLTMLDLHNFALKRSLHPVHYVYVFHAMSSTHMADFANSYDHYDSIFCVGPHHVREIRRREELHGLPPKHLFEHGYARLEALIQTGSTQHESPAVAPVVLVAPTWGEGSTLNVCGAELLNVLLDAGFEVILRPHHETAKRHPGLIESLRDAHRANPRFRYVARMAETESLLRSDTLVCDWSSMALEYALGLGKPVLFVDVPRRTRNPDYRKLGLTPLEEAIRPLAGELVSPSELQRAPALIRGLLADPHRFQARIARLRQEHVFNLGLSAANGAREIVRLAGEQARNRAEQHGP